MEPEETATLVRRAAAGDESAWGALVTAYAGLVWAVARAHRLGAADAEDVAQTTWEKFARSMGKGDINQPERAGAWLSTTARRESLRVLATRNRAVPTGDLGWIGASPTDETPEEVALAREQSAVAARVWQALNQLGENCRRVLRVLMADPPPSYADAAAALGVTVGYLGPTRKRCLEKLRRLVSEPVESGHDR
ncbi:sigma-70 family RNA polymerase sigma factor [Actinoplanes sp. NPDC051411]|uniref:RNA polymerase sigma factor n=1 Tax=Actinoplanes sp. NPDC051411 TaxID=3155522 RepID=UPI003420E00E